MAVELKGPNPCVTEADEEGWMIVNLSGKSHLRGVWGPHCGVFLRREIQVVENSCSLMYVYVIDICSIDVMMRMMQGEESVGAWCNDIHTTATSIVFVMAMETRGSFYIHFLPLCDDLCHYKDINQVLKFCFGSCSETTQTRKATQNRVKTNIMSLT